MHSKVVCMQVLTSRMYTLSLENNGGTKRRIYFPQLDLYLQQDKAEIFLKGRGMKSLAVCNVIEIVLMKNWCSGSSARL